MATTPTKTSTKPTNTETTELQVMTVSGMTPASGVGSTATSGPWMIEEQTLTIDYTRVPTFGVSSVSHSLSNPSRAITVTNSILNVRVVASYSKTKSYEFFTTSGWIQPQTFIYDTLDQDNYGNSYGSTGASGLGPNGTINTLEKWYYRRPWLSSIDVESSEICEGTSHYFKGFSGVNSFGSPVYNPPADGSLYWGEFGRTTPHRSHAHTFLDGDGHLQVDRSVYTLQGPYAVSNETAQRIQQTIDLIGNKVRALDLYGVGQDLTQPSLNEEGETIALKDAGCSAYSSSRHEWN